MSQYVDSYKTGGIDPQIQIFESMQRPSASKRRQNCLDKMQKLRKQVEKDMNIRDKEKNMSKYKVHFEVTQPSNLIGGTLQQHQLQSLEWMIGLATQEANGILADDMGLGKTIQSISYMAYLKQQSGIRGKHLVICPKSVQQNWYKQIRKWLPCANVHVLLGTQNEREECLKKIVRPKHFDILITTYETVKKCVMQLSRITWEVLIVDQAHKIKNPQSQNFACINYLKACFKLLLTGTPLSNNLCQLWTLLNFVMPDIFTDISLFDEVEECVEEFQGDEEEQLAFRVKAAKHFHKIIGPFFKRRSKKDLELGLPPKIEKTLYVSLSKMQLGMYKNFLRYGSVYGDNGTENRHFMNARKICLHPYLFPKIWPQNIDQDEQDFGEHFIENCGKLKVLDKLLKKLLSEKHKVLLFSQFTMLLDLLEEYCAYRGFTFCRLDGNTSIEEREQYMEDFNKTDKYQIFMLSTKAGGLGINLVGADRVILYDIDWNPQNDIQAMDRAYRIGQKSTVHVYKLITEHTIEQRMFEIQKYKLIWDELVIQKGAFMTKKKDDPFQKFNMQNLAALGKGEIFRLEVDEKDRNIEEILILGDQKDKEMEKQIRARLQKNMDNPENIKANIFAEDSDEEDTLPHGDQQMMWMMRRNYDNDKRYRNRFEKDKNNQLPAFKFYLKSQKIKELMFEIHMEYKRDKQDQNQKLLDYLHQQLDQAKKAGKFENWDKQEYEAFLSAHQLFFYDEYANIANFIQTKTADQVEEYSKHFFNKAPNSDLLSYDLDRVNMAQKILKLKTKMEMENKGLNDPRTRNTEQGQKLLNKQKHQLNAQFEALWKSEEAKKRGLEMKQSRVKKTEEQQKRREQFQKKRQEQRLKKQQQREQIEKRKQERRLAKEIRDEQKRKRKQAHQELLKQRQQKKQQKERQMQQRKEEKEAKIRQRELKMAAQQEEANRKLQILFANPSYIKKEALRSFKIGNEQKSTISPTDNSDIQSSIDKPIQVGFFSK